MTTLTYNPNEVPEGELTAAEQESLAIGEKGDVCSGRVVGW